MKASTMYLIKLDNKFFMAESVNLLHDVCDPAQDVVSILHSSTMPFVHDRAGASVSSLYLLQTELDRHLGAYSSVPRKDRALGDVLEQTGFASTLVTNYNHSWKFELDLWYQWSDIVQSFVEAAERAGLQSVDNTFYLGRACQ